MHHRNCRALKNDGPHANSNLNNMLVNISGFTLKYIGLYIVCLLLHIRVADARFLSLVLCKRDSLSTVTRSLWKVIDIKCLIFFGLFKRYFFKLLLKKVQHTVYFHCNLH